MTGWLALVGGNEWREGCAFDARLLAAAPTRGEGSALVTVVATAAAFEGPAAAERTATAWFHSLGAETRSAGVFNRTDAEDSLRAASLREASMLYLSGGSALHLRSVMKETPCWDALLAAWRGGAVLAASSAGAMVLGDPMVDPRGGAYMLGLGVVPNLAVVPHANTWSADRRKRTLKMASAGLVVAFVDEQTALLRSPEGVWSADGVGGVELLRDGATLTLDQLGEIALVQ